MAATGEQVISSKDGTLIYVKQFNAADPKAQVLVNHGYLEHCLRYTDFAEHLSQKKDISVTVFDYRGHGKSKGARGYLDDWQDYINDMNAARSTLLPTLPTFLLGHSNGGLVVLDALLQQDEEISKTLKGVVVLSPYVAPNHAVPWIKIFASKVLGKYFPSITVPADLTAAEVTNCPQKQKEHDEDSVLLNKATVGWALQTMTAQERMQTMVLEEDAGKLSIPLLFAYAGADQVSNPKINEEIADKLQATDKTVIKREGEQHEILNEVNRMELFDIIADWILKRA
jgi:alpha-beta hydrolase superfamily lysophospholipase